MFSTRAAFRLQRAARLPPRLPQRTVPRVRFASTEAAPKTAGGASGAVTGGLAGGGAALLITYLWYRLSGAQSAVQTAKQAKGYWNSATDQLKVKFDEKTPDTDTAIKTLRDTANKYAAFVPGARQYVDGAFNDLETVRQKHGDEVDKIVREAYEELRDVSKKGISMQTASETYEVLSKHVQRLLGLAEDAAEDLLNNHPQLKEKLGGSAEQLKQLGHRIGPEAKKQIDETWSEVQKIASQGLQPENIDRARQLVNDKVEQFKKLAEKAFDEGWEQLKPVLDRNPEVKKFVEQNLETLKQGNTGELVDKVRKAVSSGNTQELQDYAQQIKDKAQQYASGSGGQLSDWLKSIPHGDQVMPQLQKLWKIAEQQGPEAQDIAKGTVSDIKQVLDKRMQEAEKLSKST